MPAEFARLLWGSRTTSLIWLGGCLLACALSGCGLPTWSELVGTKQEEAAPVVVVPTTPTPPPQPTPPPEPPKPNAQELVAKFQSLKPHEIDDNALLALTSLDEGLEVVESLDLRGSGVTAGGLKNLAKLSNLKSVDIRGTQLDASGLAAIANAPSVTELQVDGRRVTAEGAAALAPLSDLKVLVAEGLMMTPAMWETFIMAHPNLEELAIRQSNMTDPVMAVIGRLTNLRKLIVNDTSVSDEGLAMIANLDNLEWLSLSSCRITGIGFRPKGGGKFNKLETLYLQDTPLNEVGAKAISQMKQLRVLHLSGMGSMQDIHLAAIVKPLTNLEHLSVVKNTGLTSNALVAVAGHKNLRELNVSMIPGIGDAGLKHLLKCKELQWVDLGGTSCSIQGALALKQALPQVEIRGFQQQAGGSSGAHQGGP